MVKLVSNNEEKFPNAWLFPFELFDEVLSPRVEPHDEKSIRLIEDLVDELGLRSSRPTSHKKICVLLTSLIFQSYRLERKVEEGKSSRMLIGWPHGKGYWTDKKVVGHVLASQVREKLIKAGWLSFVREAEINLFTHEGYCSGYELNQAIPSYQLKVVTSDLLPTVVGVSKSKLDPDVDERIRKLWRKWEKQPLVYQGNYFTKATRTFSDYEKRRGGRFQGSWTTMRKAERLKCTISGNPVAEVDVRGMYPTLLASYASKIPFTRHFEDPYKCGYDGDREHIKAYLTEAIGAGNPRKNQIGGRMDSMGLTNEDVKRMNQYIRPFYQCLSSLRKGYIDSEFFAYHESEIMFRVAERASKWPVYILHDCLICVAQDAQRVAERIQATFGVYVEEQGWKRVYPAVKIEYADGSSVIKHGSR